MPITELTIVRKSVVVVTESKSELELSTAACFLALDVTYINTDAKPSINTSMMVPVTRPKVDVVLNPIDCGL
jgi:hypothetical protein